MFSLEIPEYIQKDKNKYLLNLDSSDFEFEEKIMSGFIDKLKDSNFFDLAWSRNLKTELLLKVNIREYLKIEEFVSNSNIVFWFWSYSILERLAWKFLDKWLMIWEFPQFRFFPMEYIKSWWNYEWIDFVNDTLPYNKIIQRIINKWANIECVYINNPNNPTWQVRKMSELINLIEVANKQNIYVVVDEAYWDLLPSANSCSKLINKFNNLIVVRSFSKIFKLNNIRLWYMISSNENITKYNKICNWNEITNIWATMWSYILWNKSYKNEIVSTYRTMKKKTIKLFENKWFKVCNTSESTPLLIIKSDKIKNLWFYFYNKNIKVETSDSYKVIKDNFDYDFVRIFIPTIEDNFKLLKERLWKSLN